MINHNIYLRIGTALGALLLVVLPTSGDAQKINQRLNDLRLEIVGVTIDMPDGQSLGRSLNGGLIRWDAVITPDDRVSSDQLLGIEHFEFAGLPVVPGTEVSLTKGLFGPARFRLGGRLTSLSIDLRGQYEIRAHVDWSIYDTRTSTIIAEQVVKGLGKGFVLGDRGEQPNALMDSVIDSLEEFLNAAGEKAIKAAQS
ncbi:MAG: hypothetical protein E4H28_02570 [Gemmatimonadales bacterium]|nr:MAG: hypothetical protein E4H28_02570 [Gemmatimonadales bacterium]